MAGETQAQRLTSLEARVLRIETQYTERSVRQDEYITALKSAVRDLEREVGDLRTVLAGTNERCTALQRQSDRGWVLWQALLVLAISIAASAVTQLALHK